MMLLTHKKQEHRILIGAYSSLSECTTSLNKALANGSVDEATANLIRAYSALVRLDGILWAGTFLVDGSIDATSPQGLGGFSKIATDIILKDTETIGFKTNDAVYREQLYNLYKDLTNLKNTITGQDGQISSSANISIFIERMHELLITWTSEDRTIGDG